MFAVDKAYPTNERLATVAGWIDNFGGPLAVDKYLSDLLTDIPQVRAIAVQEPKTVYGADDAEVVF